MAWSLFLLFMMGLRSCFTYKLYEYHVVNVNKSWDDARAYCREHHTDLATVSNRTDQDALRSLTVDGGEAWIGLFNHGSGDKIWHWSLPGLEDDNYTNWAIDQQNQGHNCVIINTDGKRNSAACPTRYPFVCYSDGSQPGKYVFIDNPKRWLEAQSFCRENHTDLVSGKHQLQDDQLKNITANKEAYIGLFRDTWRWSDGSSSSFRNWEPHKAFVQAVQRCAVFMKNEEKWWEAKECNEKKTFICYDDKVILIQKKMNWEDALYYCRNHHHDLVSITNLDEQRWVQEKAKNATTPYVWTGLRYTCTLDFWFWVSDEAASYKNWASGQDWDDCDMSGAMKRGGEHQWFKKNDSEKFNFICSKRVDKW